MTAQIYIFNSRFRKPSCPDPYLSESKGEEDYAARKTESSPNALLLGSLFILH